MAHRYWRIWLDSTDSAAAGCQLIEMFATLGGANIATGGTATAVSNYSGWSAPNAFNGTTSGNGWSSTGGSAPFWIQYDFGSAVNVVSFKWYARTGTEANQSPRTGRLAYSDDNVTWTDSFSFTEPVWTSGAARTIAPLADTDLNATGLGVLLFMDSVTSLAASTLQPQILYNDPKVEWAGAEVQAYTVEPSEVQVAGIEVQVWVSTAQKAQGGYFQVHRYPSLT